MVAGAVGRTPAAAPAPERRLRAGAAAIKITPALSRPVYIAGYENNRVAESVHDDLWVRALVLDDGATRMAVVACDLIGLSNTRVRAIRSRIKAVPSENVLIAATHVHSGPDTLGLWGPSALQTGIDPIYMTRLEDRIVAAIDSAAANIQPVTLSIGSTTVPDGLVYNSREPIQDRELTALRFVGDDGRTVSSVIHYGGHPEVNKSKAITSDFVHYVREAVEAKYSGVCLFLNGALGGMVTPKISGHTLAEMQRVGEGVGKSAVQALERAEVSPGAMLSLKRREVALPLENEKFKIAISLKLLDGDAPTGSLNTEVWRVDLGRATWITIPGEILPKPAFELKDRMPGKYRMIVALGNDELGYIVHPSDWDKDRYKYERSMSVGSQTWPLLFDAARELIK